MARRRRRLVRVRPISFFLPALTRELTTDPHRRSHRPLCPWARRRRSAFARRGSPDAWSQTAAQSERAQAETGAVSRCARSFDRWAGEQRRATRAAGPPQDRTPAAHLLGRLLEAVAADEYSAHRLVRVLEIPSVFKLGARALDQHITPARPRCAPARTNRRARVSLAHDGARVEAGRDAARRANARRTTASRPRWATGSCAQS